MIAIANIFFQSFVNQSIQSCIKIFHAAKIKKPRSAVLNNLLAYLIRFKNYLFNHLSPVFCFHKNSGSVSARFCFQKTNTILSTTILAFELYIKTCNAIIIKKIFKNHYCLGFAVIVCFMGK